MTATHTNEISGVPYLRPVPSHPDEAAALVQQYPVVVACMHGEDDVEGALMVRDTSCDSQGDTARMRYYRGCHEVFRCEVCGGYELFPPVTMTLADVRDEYPAWGSLAGWPSDQGAA